MPNRSPLISIVVPIYNTEQYLDRCIESIVSQSHKNIEIILVNDGSIDSSGAICDEWAEKDHRIKVIHKNNEGVTIARKTGVEEATGEWICFVDSDDKLPENAIQILSSQIRDDVDMVHGTIKTIGHKDFRYKHFGEKNTIQYSKVLLKDYVYWGPTARLVKRSLFDDFIFDMPKTITEGEDIIMNFRLAQKVRLVILLPDIVYFYVWRMGSAVSNNRFLNKKYRRVFFKSFNESVSFEYRKYLQGAIVYFLIVKYWKIVKDMIKKVLPFWSENHYEP
mgnify:FL=1|jgi:glycosyltransferase involved in cell wall biosynthesis